MKKIIFILLIAVLGANAQIDVSKLTVTRDPRTDPDYVSYQEWKAAHPQMGTLKGGPAVIRTSPDLNASSFHADKGLICLVVAQDIKPRLTNDLNRYVEDLEARGYSVEQSVYSITGTAEDLRDYLADKLSDGLAGAVLVGNLPVAWFQMNDDWNDNGQFDPDEDWYEDFPCDLFLSDLDGDWHDDSIYAGHGPLAKGTDGMYDSHSGNKQAEIWVSRINAANITLEDEMTLYHDYFQRAHDYREGDFALPSKGIFFIDQDWRESFYDEKMNLVVNDYKEIRDSMITDAGEYEDLISEDGLFVTICSHSSPEAHYLHKANWPAPDMFHNWKIPYVDPQYGFYNLFACSNARWVEQNCMGSLYHFFGNGLASLGTTKTGSMLFFSEFNTALAADMSWGDSFKEWTNFWIANYGYSKALQSWFMGMCILGDATLDLGNQMPVAVAEQEILPLALSLKTTSIAAGKTFLRLSVPQTGCVQLTVFDASGRLVENIYNGTLSAGEHTLTWDASQASAGVYFIRVATGEREISTRTVVAK